MRRVALLGALGLTAAVLAAAAADGGSAVNRPLLGVAGKADRFQRHTGQTSTVRHVFLGWEQGRSCRGSGPCPCSTSAPTAVASGARR
ncbi:MAG: hypothetical protein HOQ03_11585 [Thermoleophilia bacterium]|nr:hypothetical protein [Thermoleophilia bacterium]